MDGVYALCQGNNQSASVRLITMDNLVINQFMSSTKNAPQMNAKMEGSANRAMKKRSASAHLIMLERTALELDYGFKLK